MLEGAEQVMAEWCTFEGGVDTTVQQPWSRSAWPRRGVELVPCFRVESGQFLQLVHLVSGDK